MGRSAKAAGDSPRTEKGAGKSLDVTRASNKTALGIDVHMLLTSISDMLKEKQLRVIDLFRNPTYNPSYLTNRDEELDADEVASVLSKAGVELAPAECQVLIRVLDTQGKGVLHIRELESAVRKLRQGCTDWSIPEAAPTQGASPSRLGWQRAPVSKAAGQGDGGEDDAEEVPGGAKAMGAISSLLDEKKMRLQDLFRHPTYNPSYTEGAGNEAMNAKTIHGVLQKAGLDLPVPDVRQMLECLDDDNSGSLDIKELEVALRNHRRGVLDWKALSERAAQNRKEKKAVNMEHLHRLSEAHREKLEKLKAKREEMEVKEDQMIREAKAKNRLGSRKDLTEKDFDPLRSIERLHNQRAELEHRRRQMQQEAEAKEQERIERQVAKIRGMRSASTPCLRDEDISIITDRLHGYAEARDRYRNDLRRKAETALLSLTDTIGQRASARGTSTPERHLQLYDEAELRRDRRENQARKCLVAENAMWAEQLVGRGREALTPEKMSRIKDLYEEKATRDERRKNMALDRFKQEMVEIQRAAEKAREHTAKKLEAATGRLRDCAPFKTPESSITDADASKRTARPVGFGTQTPRSWLFGDEPKSSWCIESVDHALGAINAAVAVRCNCAPSEAQLEGLRDLVEPLKEAMQEFRDASAESEQHGQGIIALRNMNSRRLFADGSLLEDPVGWHECCEPDPLMQVEDDFEALMEIAERAQAALLAKIGPADRSDGVALGRSWPVGAKWNHPRATKKAHFAVNAGVKPRERALVKASVRYGPSSGEDRYRHLTDLARCSLVFVDAFLLRAGLEQIVENFEVIDVRNHYHASYQNLLGEKYVEVLVVIQCPEPFICEIRLEEMSFMMARERVRPRLDKITTTLADIYQQAGADEDAIKYLVQWVLHKPKENHSVTVFKKHLSRRFGSTVVAWRKTLGNGRLAPFAKFREACQSVGQRHRTVEFWQSLDAARAGCVSLFELDPDATILLIKVYWRVCGLATPEQMADPNALFQRLTANMKLVSPGKIQADEFRRLLKPLGFTVAESDRVFACLDAHGGDASVPPATVTPMDIGWLQRLPKLVDFESAMVRTAQGMTELDTLRTLMSSAGGEGRRMRMPAGVGSRKSVHGAEIASCIPRASMFARRSVSAPPGRGLLFAHRAAGARGSAGGSTASSPRHTPRLLPPPPPAAEGLSEADEAEAAAADDPSPVESPAGSPRGALGDPSSAPPPAEAAGDVPRQPAPTAGPAARPRAKARAASSRPVGGDPGDSGPPLEFSVGDTVRVAEQLLDSKRSVVKRGLTGKVLKVDTGAQASVLVAFSGMPAPVTIAAKDAGGLVVAAPSPTSGKASSRLDSTGSTDPDAQHSKSGGGGSRRRSFFSDDEEGLELQGGTEGDGVMGDDMSDTF